MSRTMKRLLIWMVGVVTLILVDEWVKEGYLFDPQDLLKFPSHESILIVAVYFFIVLIVYYIIFSKHLS